MHKQIYSTLSILWSMSSRKYIQIFTSLLTRIYVYMYTISFCCVHVLNMYMFRVCTIYVYVVYMHILNLCCEMYIYIYVLCICTMYTDICTQTMCMLCTSCKFSVQMHRVHNLPNIRGHHRCGLATGRADWHWGPGHHPSQRQGQHQTGPGLWDLRHILPHLRHHVCGELSDFVRS